MKKDNEPFKKIDKFGIQLLVAFFISISVIVLSNIAFAEPKWAEKPIQCASYQEVAARAKADNMTPLLTMEGNARIGDNMYTLPYVFYYNQNTSYWLIVEIHGDNTACIIGVGDTVNFDVSDWEQPSYKRNW